MATSKTLADRLIKITKISSQSLINCRISTSSCSVKTRIPRNPTKSIIDPDPGDHGVLDAIASNFLKSRVSLEGLAPPRQTAVDGLTVEDAKKLLMVAQLEKVKSKLNVTEKPWISYSEFVRICGDAVSDREQGIRIAKSLDESGVVIVLGNSVFLKPEKVVKAIQGLIPLPASNPNDLRTKELEKLEKQKAEIDRKANILVRRELWCGLGFFVAQTVGFMRLTFWELNWDVMEPICFYVTTMYAMAGYAFFLRTSKEPSFEGFYNSRFSVKQKRLMKIHNFDLERYNELRKGCYPSSTKVPAFNKAEML